ncbi:26348_t:CDS:1, partial [Gigaspora margarita]
NHPIAWFNETILENNIKCYDFDEFKNPEVLGFSSFNRTYKCEWKNGELIVAKFMEISDFDLDKIDF